MSAVQVALGMVTVVEAEMERAVRAVTVAEGADPVGRCSPPTEGPGGSTAAQWHAGWRCRGC